MSFFASGDVSDVYGPNDVKLDNNVLTVYIAGSNNRLVQFAGVKELSGDNNVTYRPYQAVNDPVNANHNFNWRKSGLPGILDHNNYNLRLTNTLDNGWIDSRLVCYDPSSSPQWTYCSLTGNGNSLTWINNPNSTPTASPDVTNVTIQSRIYLWVTVSEPNNRPVRVMVLHNGLPLGLKEIQNRGYVRLFKKVSVGDTFSIQAFNENGQSGEYSFTYN